MREPEHGAAREIGLVLRHPRFDRGGDVLPRARFPDRVVVRGLFFVGLLCGPEIRVDARATDGLRPYSPVGVPELLRGEGVLVLCHPLVEDKTVRIDGDDVVFVIVATPA